MFGILKRLRERKLRKEREVFTYFDGERFRSLDPWRCYRAFISHPKFEAIDMEEAAEGIEPHCTDALDAICESFGLERFDMATGRGMTDAEVFDFLSDLHTYMEDLKKKRQSGATSPSATANPSLPPQETAPLTS